MNSYFKIFSNCIPVKGVNRSTICDLQRNNYYLIPNTLYDILIELENNPIQYIKNKYAKNEDVINEYLDFLEKKELGFFCTKEEADLFPKLDLKWDYPAQITNAIIDVNIESNHNFVSLYNQLETLGCSDIQIRLYDRFTIEEIENILLPIGNKKITSIELLAKYNSEIPLKEYTRISKLYPRVKKIILHSASKEATLINNVNVFISMIMDKIENSEHCGNICPFVFNVSINFFTEAQRHNTCLNRKLSIDVNGEIKNCPAMDKSYGNHKDISLIEAIKHKNFKEYWFINKDTIEVCKDCEFRYICLDCRAFTKNSTNKYSKPLKCSYNPYTSKGFK